MTTLKDLQPKDNCPKCGEGRFALPPYYESDVTGWELEEWLEWRCEYCGYRIKTKTVDAE